MKHGRMLSWAVRFAIGLLLADIPTLRAETAEGPATMLRSAIEEIVAIAYPESGVLAPEVVTAQVRPILDRTMDFETITRRAIGPGWRLFTSAERMRAVELFTTLIVRTYAGRFTGGDRPRVDYKRPIETAPGRWEVPTQVSRGGGRYEIVYRLEGRVEGVRVYDVVAEGVSFVANYRAQFDALFQKGGAAAVLRALEARSMPATAR